MLRTALLSLFLFVSLSSSTSMLRRSIARRQTDPQYCHAIEGFECKCSYYRVTCINDRNLPSTINILQNEKNKYQSVELVITAAGYIVVNDYTFEPVKELYKPDADNLEFRIKFEKFTGLNLASPGIFNRVFPDNLPANARKHLALEIYNPEVPPNDNPGLFKNLNADSLELYALYPFHGSFQQLFDGANIKYLRLSGGDVRSDVSQPFTGNIGRLELAKQASDLSVQNFPVYPAHELTINAFYVTNFNHEHPPNYNNLGELRVFSQERIPANAFRNFPNIHTLSVSSDQDIDPQALNGLNKLEKLTVKDSKAPLELLNSVPSVKEFEANIEKLDENTQCQLLEKLANGQVAVQAIPNGRECTCVTAYLDTAGGRSPCDAPNCDQSSCSVIKNNYDASTRTFKAPPTILRSDGSDALRPRESKVYTAPFQVGYQDQEKLQKGIPAPVQQPSPDDGSRRPDGTADDSQQPNQPYNPPEYNPNDSYYPGYNNNEDIQNEPQNPGYNNNRDTQNESQNPDYNNNNEDTPSETYNSGTNNNEDTQNEPYNPGYNNNENNSNKDDDLSPASSPPTTTTEANWVLEGDQQGGSDQDGTGTGSSNQDGDNRQQGAATENQANVDDFQSGTSGPEGVDNSIVNGTDTTPPPKKGMTWLPIIIIGASIAVFLLIGLIALIIHRKRANKGYNQAATSESGGTTGPPRA